MSDLTKRGENFLVSSTSDADPGALELAMKIKAKASAILDPLRREMAIMKWAPEYRVIMWEAVAREALGEACDAKS